jgi:protein O-GlcNAc transferase
VTRQRLERAFDSFVHLHCMSDHEAAETIASHGIDVLVDLMGYTRNARPGILARRPAPVQVNYLGYPGTMAADFIDYILVDSFVVPGDHQRFFAEKLVHLPHCYMPRDTRREVAAAMPSREQAGLPEQGIVFCCFNNAYKITPEVFDIWMRLLRHAPGSCLWLLGGDHAAERNLRQKAVERGVDPLRLVFAPRIGLTEHLARHNHADLFLDTFPYNAHTTASDALWAGLPVLTCAGRAFASRVAGSLLHTLGLSELVTTSFAEYEALALALATDPARLAAVRTRVIENRTRAPVFDTDRFRCHIEAAYREMVRRLERGEAHRPLVISS